MNCVIKPGQRFNGLKAVVAGKYPLWLFECNCGELKKINKYDVIHGKVKSCGCLTKKMREITRQENTKKSLINKKFNGIKILKYVYTKNNKTYWKSLCNCGKIFVSSLGNIKSGAVRSCGCLRTRKHVPGYSGLRKVFLSYKKSAKRENRSFSLSFEDVKKLTSSKCFYCGQSPQKISQSTRTNNLAVKEYTQYKYNGIDRVDSSRGYEVGNVVPCCLWCNIIKRERSIDDFKDHVKRIYNHCIK